MAPPSVPSGACNNTCHSRERKFSQLRSLSRHGALGRAAAMNTYPIAYDRPFEEADKLHQAHRYTGHFLRDEKQLEKIRKEPPPKDTEKRVMRGRYD